MSRNASPLIVIEVCHLHLIAGKFRLTNLSLCIPTGAYAVLMGRSGCGKTSLLEAIAGIRQIQSGSIRLGNAEVTKRQPAERGVGYVPQDRAIFPTLRVRDQLAFSLVIRRLPSAQIDKRVNALAKLLGIDHLLDQMPDGLSGGESGRVALGRALACDPSVLLLDEPLNGLDEALHDETCQLLKIAHHHSNATVLHITHSAQEARRLGNCHFKLEDGKATPFEF